MARHMVGVIVGLKDVLDPHPEVARQPQVLVDLQLGVDDRGNAGVLVTNQIARAPQVIVSDLTKDHALFLARSVARPALSQPRRSGRASISPTSSREPFIGESVAEDGRMIVADPLEHWGRARELRVGDQSVLIEPTGVDADRTDEQPTPTVGVLLKQSRQWRASSTGRRLRMTRKREPNCFL